MTKAKVTPDASSSTGGNHRWHLSSQNAQIHFTTGENSEQNAIGNGKTHQQFSSIYYCRVQLAEQCSSSMVAVESKVVYLLDLPCSQSSNNSPRPRRKKRAHREGGKRSP